MTDLFADWVVLRPGDVLLLDSAEAWIGVLWRLGADAHRLRLLHGERFTAEEAVRFGLADAIGEPEDSRSAVALESAAMLIRHRGGDALERAEFARLFAIGEPQKGLAAFLEKRSPVWSAAAKLPL